jgi:hypothetical protein
MTDAEPQVPLEAPIAGTETETLLGSLERQRRILAWKCGGLDAAGLRATAAASTMTLGGLLKHLVLVEDEYFSVRLLGRPPVAPWDTVNWDADPDWEWWSAAVDTPDELMELWRDAAADPAPRSPQSWPTAAWTPGLNSSPGAASRPACAACSST